MTDPLLVRAGERGVVRVFSVTIEAGDLRALRMPGAIDTALGMAGVDGYYVELFPVSDLAGVGLATYLSDGCDVPEEVVTPDAARLDAVEGVVMVVLSRAFQGQEARIVPAAQLRLIGTYSQTPVDWTPNGPIETASALPGSGVAQAPYPASQPARRAGAAVFAIFIALVALIVLLVVL